MKKIRKKITARQIREAKSREFLNRAVGIVDAVEHVAKTLKEFSAKDVELECFKRRIPSEAVKEKLKTVLVILRSKKIIRKTDKYVPSGTHSSRGEIVWIAANNTGNYFS
jgi:hypothetical protein